MKDEFYYEDLIYVIKGLAGIGEMNDATINERIIAREQPKEIRENGHRSFTFSNFSLELLELMHKVGLMAGVKLNRLEDLRLYPKEVLVIIAELEKVNKYSLVRK